MKKNPCTYYRYSGACRLVENGFGILSARWKIYITPIQAKPENIEKIALATIALHNTCNKLTTLALVPMIWLIAKDQLVKLVLDIGEGTPPLPVQVMKVLMERSI